MTHRGGAVWTERVFLALILASLAGTLNLILTMHRLRLDPTTLLISPTRRNHPSPRPSPSTPTAPNKVSSSPSVPTQPRPVPAAPVEDPTIKVLAGLTRATATENAAAQEADRRTAKLEMARKAAVGESERWKRRESLVKQQIATLSQRAQRLEQDASELDAERDVLRRERDALKAALTRAGQHSGNSILPYKGPNGTWRRPIVIECMGNVAKLQPQGQTFSMMELSPLINPRSSPVVLAIAREMLRIERAGTPDGSPVVPYLVFMVRPNGIRPYYEVRARLEPLGIAFGYELVEQDLAVDIPNYDDLTTWDGSAPLDIASSTTRPQTGWPSTSATDSRGRNRTQAPAVLPPEGPAMAGDSGMSGAWPSSRDGGATPGSGPGPGSRYPTRGGRPGSGPNHGGHRPRSDAGKSGDRRAGLGTESGPGLPG